MYTLEYRIPLLDRKLRFTLNRVSYAEHPVRLGSLPGQIFPYRSVYHSC